MASTGRFQSRMFSLVSQQSLRLRDRLAQTLRQVKVGIVWGTQIALYPIYALFQSARLVDRQLRQATRQAYPRLQAANRVIQRIIHPTRPSLAPKADTPVRRVLRAVKEFVTPVALPSLPAGLRMGTSPTDPPLMAPLSALQLAETQAIAATLELSGTVEQRLTTLSEIEAVGEIQGIASLLSNRAMVLVTNHNQILDILTAEQQWQLRQQIAWEVAGYWRERKRLQAAKRSLPPFLPLPMRRKNLLPPVQQFRQLMAWMQTSPIAVATNLFQESTFVAIVQVSLDSQLAIARQLGGKALNLLSAAESTPDTSNTPAKWHVPLLPAANTAVNWAHWLFQRSVLQLSPEGGSLVNLSAPNRMSDTGLDAPANEGLPDNPPLLQRSQGSPTLRFGFPFQSVSLTNAAWNPDASLPSVGAAQTAQPQISDSSTTSTPAKLLQAAAEAATSLVKGATSPSVEHQASYIDTQATFIGYVRHPLEQLLTWLDRGMAWLEEQVPHWWNRLQEQAISADFPALRQRVQELWQHLRDDVTAPDFVPRLRDRVLHNGQRLRQQITTDIVPRLNGTLKQGWQSLRTWISAEVVPTVQAKLPELQAKAAQFWQWSKAQVTDPDRIAHLKQTVGQYQQRVQEQMAASDLVAQVKQTVGQQHQRLQNYLASSDAVAQIKHQVRQLWQRFRR